ncbi:MAG: hypothetical protein NT069_14360 [Planctomycetota bacterium]|nr:hypothetical protein [Planctomycetota bacterium]
MSVPRQPDAAASHQDSADFSTGRAASRWLIYALGGGMGHLTRGLALARRAARDGATVQVVSNSRFAQRLLNSGVFSFDPSVAAHLSSSGTSTENSGPNRWQPLIHLEPGIELIAIPPDLVKEAVSRTVRRIIGESAQFDVLVVDTFPRGLAGELTELLPSCPATKVLVHRDLSPDYVTWAGLETFIDHYDLVLVPGEDAPLSGVSRAQRTAPWFLCDTSELLAPAAAREALGISTGIESPGQTQLELPVVVVVGTGKPVESLSAAVAADELSRRLVGQATVRFASFDNVALDRAGSLGCSPWPLLVTLRGVDLLIGAGGYNTVHEARATSTPLVATAQPRLYDRQDRRLHPGEMAQSWNHALDLAVLHIEGMVSRPRAEIGQLSLGIDAACRAILNL